MAKRRTIAKKTSSGASRKRSKTAAKRKAPPAAVESSAASSVDLTPYQEAWFDSIVSSVKDAGGPTFTREQVLHALVDAAVGRRLEWSAIRTVDDLRRAFADVDLSTVQRMLKERPRIESGLLKALEDTIK